MTNYSKDRGVMFSSQFNGQTQNVVLDTEYRNWSKTWRRPSLTCSAAARSRRSRASA